MKHYRGLNYFCIITSLLFLSLLFCNTNSETIDDASDRQSVVINEICADNFSTAPVQYRENADWIELYNASDSAVNLAGWSISDEEDDLIEGCILPEIVLQPHEFYTIYATKYAHDKEAEFRGEQLHLNFCLSEIETVSLIDRNGHLVDSVVLADYRQNTSMSRDIDGVGEWTNTYPTLNESNNNADKVQSIYVEKPVFSLEPGFYSGMQFIELQSEDGLDIYYTLDGSEPTIDSLLYTDPIIVYNKSTDPNGLSSRMDVSTVYHFRYVPDELVDKINVIRAIAVDQDGNVSEVATGSYVIDLNPEIYHDMYMVSISMDADKFFNLEDGLYVLGLEYIIQMEEDPDNITVEPNYEQRGRLSECPANIEIFDGEGIRIMSQNAGIRVRGNSTREVSQKSFGLFARDMYSGTEYFEENIFGYQTDRLILLSDRDQSKMQHELHAKLVEDRNVGVQDFIRCNVFFDGEYWGIYSLAQVYTPESIEHTYGVAHEDVLIEYSTLPEELEVICKNEDDLSDEELYLALDEKMDIDSYIDYCAAMIYMDDYDWLAHNGYSWKTTTISAQPYNDGKWRWLVYDTGECEREYDRDTFAEGLNYSFLEDPIIQVLMKNEEFRKKFVITFMDLANTTFRTENVHEEMEEILLTYSQAIESQGIRWGDDWRLEIDKDLEHIRDFYVKRFPYITKHLKKEFDLQGKLADVQIINEYTSDGVVKINTAIPEFENGIWYGQYFMDYPIELEVIPNSGAEFIGWYDENGELISRENKIEVSLSEKNVYKVHFE